MSLVGSLNILCQGFALCVLPCGQRSVETLHNYEYNCKLLSAMQCGNNFKCLKRAVFVIFKRALPYLAYKCYTGKTAGKKRTFPLAFHASPNFCFH